MKKDCMWESITFDNSLNIDMDNITLLNNIIYTKKIILLRIAPTLAFK